MCVGGEPWGAAGKGASRLQGSVGLERIPALQPLWIQHWNPQECRPEEMLLWLGRMRGAGGHCSAPILAPELLYIQSQFWNTRLLILAQDLVDVLTVSPVKAPPWPCAGQSGNGSEFPELERLCPCSGLSGVLGGADPEARLSLCVTAALCCCPLVRVTNPGVLSQASQPCWCSWDLL